MNRPEKLFLPQGIKNTRDLFYLIDHTVGRDLANEAEELLKELEEKADYTSQRLNTDLDSYEATLDEQRALLLDILGELEELERGDLTKSNLIRRISEIRTTIYNSL